MPSFYNRGIARRIDPPPPPRAQRAVVVVLLAQVALAALMPALPTAPGAVRVAGVNLLWWYTGLLVPVLSVLAAAIIRR